MYSLLHAQRVAVVQGVRLRLNIKTLKPVKPGQAVVKPPSGFRTKTAANLRFKPNRLFSQSLRKQAFFMEWMSCRH